ncbi:MAG: hypothetical protein WCI05_19630 [Myxococcales bacterium]
MEPRFLFFTGEPATTLPLLKGRPTWAPVVSTMTFDVTGGRLHRRRSTTEGFHGVVYFADARDKDVERHNLRTMATHAIPCWPNPVALLAASGRHDAIDRCVAEGLIDHRVVQSQFTSRPPLAFPYVLKVGEEHRGEGKYLIRAAEDIPRWEGIATMEPFFEGESVRVLLVGDRAFGVKVLNDHSWIKNSMGASFEPWEPDEAMVKHARRAAALFGLEIVGVDYVVDAAGFHFIELNPFPRLGMSRESASAAREVLRRAMDDIEARCEGGTR